MNYLAHLFLAQTNADSYFGNLLGDFGGNRYIEKLPHTVTKGLENHYLVDKYTDHHALVKQAKALFSPARRRFSGIAVDVLFDHFLIHHWSNFHSVPFNKFKQNSYFLLKQSIPSMPSNMQKVIYSLTKNDWFKEYESVEGIGLALDNIAKRIRFTNQFNGCIEDIVHHYDELETLFLAFFPQLIAHVDSMSIEKVTIPSSPS